ncbi:2-succinyl-6-hydroxy-2,4-cyclohexadiene-1-carboxylate synthase [Gemmatimonadota bacterium Y43]|uniref:2-succinyl-6-hydroxy-2, 4-cyclohexadiene-1-carboxylate synthase n=1 Tax=Gaopeijia maritima TaxID=3119007 RepID=UPI003271625E
MTRSHRLEVDGGLHLHLVDHDHGPHAAPPLVLVHGFMGSTESWGDLPARLSRHRRVIVPDLPGHGRSDRPGSPDRYGVLEVAGALARMAEGLRLGAADWLGYSMGGRIVLAGAAEGLLDPRRLILESASPGLETEAERAERRAADERLARRLEVEGLAPFVDDWLALPLFATLSPDARERARRLRLANDAHALAACLRGGGTGVQRSYWRDLPQVEVPTLVLTGARDPKFTRLGHRMATALPFARSEGVADAGHAVHAEAPDAWARAVTGWVGSD